MEIHASGEVIRALTAVINLNGALILCSVNWPQGSELKFRNPYNGLMVSGRVVWSGDVALNGQHKLGVEFAAAAPEFWGNHYDPNSSETPESSEPAESATREKTPSRR